MKKSEFESKLKEMARAKNSGCNKCLAKMQQKNPSMCDCAFRHNNDEHLCENNVVEFINHLLGVKEEVFVLTFVSHEFIEDDGELIEEFSGEQQEEFDSFEEAKRFAISLDMNSSDLCWYEKFRINGKKFKF